MREYESVLTPPAPLFIKKKTYSRQPMKVIGYMMKKIGVFTIRIHTLDGGGGGGFFF